MDSEFGGNAEGDGRPTSGRRNLPAMATAPAVATTNTATSARKGGARGKAILPPLSQKAICGSPSPALSLTDTIDRLIDCQRTRRHCIVSQSRCDRSADDFIVQHMPHPKVMTEGQKKKMFSEAKAIRVALEKGKYAQAQGAPLLGPTSIRAILNSAMSRAIWDELLAETVAEMERLARTLPVYPWIEAGNCRGFSALGLAVITAEAGDPTAYRNRANLWKRLGLGVIGGIRQRRVKGEGAKRHGYNACRRAECWAFAESMFRQQWRGPRDEDGNAPATSGKPVAEPAHAIGVYGEVYARRRAWTLPRIEATAHLPPKHPDRWFPARCNADGRRIMFKALVKDIRKEWRRAVREAQAVQDIAA